MRIDWLVIGIQPHTLVDSAYAAFIEPAGERLAVDLTVGVKWEFVDSDYSLQDHGARQPLSQPLLQPAGRS